MIKIKILKTGDVQEVTRNVAFDLIDRGLARIFKARNRRMKTTDSKTSKAFYRNRQMKTA